MLLADARAIADKTLAQLTPYCIRASIAGSIRREKPDCKDIELVVIPRSRDLAQFADAVNRWHKIKGEPSGRYTQRYLPDGIKLDLFMAELTNFGAILLIRTGDANFSEWFVAEALPKAGFRMKEGWVHKRGLRIPTFEEGDMFRLAGLDYIPPSQRIGRRP